MAARAKDESIFRYQIDSSITTTLVVSIHSHTQTHTLNYTTHMHTHTNIHTNATLVYNYYAPDSSFRTPK